MIRDLYLLSIPNVSVYSMSDSKAAQDYLLATSPPSWTDSDVDTIMLDSMNLEPRGSSSISILSSSLRRPGEMEAHMELDAGKLIIRGPHRYPIYPIWVSYLDVRFVPFHPPPNLMFPLLPYVCS